MKKSFLVILIGIGISTFTEGSSKEAAYCNDISGNSNVLIQQKKETALKTVYVCPMHSEVVQDKQGKCPKCGMDLKAKEVRKDVYACPMHSEVVQDKPGKCPKCGMNLTLKTPEKKSESTKK
jgi:hypothetical protein